MKIVCVSDSKCINMNVLVKAAPLGRNAVNMLDSVNISENVKILDSVNVLENANAFDCVNVFDLVNPCVGGRHSLIVVL